MKGLIAEPPTTFRRGSHAKRCVRLNCVGLTVVESSFLRASRPFWADQSILYNMIIICVCAKSAESPETVLLSSDDACRVVMRDYGPFDIILFADTCRSCLWQKINELFNRNWSFDVDNALMWKRIGRIGSIAGCAPCRVVKHENQF